MMSIATVTSSSVIVQSWAVSPMLLQHKPLGDALLIVVRFLLHFQPFSPIFIDTESARGLGESVN